VLFLKGEAENKSKVKIRLKKEEKIKAN